MIDRLLRMFMSTAPQWHGLLDWRLGLSTLLVLRIQRFRAGLDGILTGPGFARWAGRWRVGADDVAEVFGGIGFKSPG